MLAFLFTLFAGWFGLHPDSQSSSSLVVRGRDLQLELRCQALSVIEAVELDRDGNLTISAEELALGAEELGRYLERRYVVSQATPRAGWAFELTGGGLEPQHVLARRAFELPEGAAGLELGCTLFQERNPLHRDIATVRWNDDEPAVFLFGEGLDTWRFECADARRPGVLASYFRLGVEHIVTGYDHLAFLLALIVAARRLRSLVAVVTAFTASHSISLALAALDLVHVPGLLVELAIALSIAYVGCETLLVRKPASRWLEAFGFGLVHGLGFAGFLGESLLYEPLKLSALAGFNLGVEAGQLGAVLLAFLCLRWLPGSREHEGEPRAWLAPKWLRWSVSALVAACGFWWFLERAGWL